MRKFYENIIQLSKYNSFFAQRQSNKCFQEGSGDALYTKKPDDFETHEIFKLGGTMVKVTTGKSTLDIRTCVAPLNIGVARLCRF